MYNSKYSVFWYYTEVSDQLHDPAALLTEKEVLLLTG
jgi:hypothetical protein